MLLGWTNPAAGQPAQSASGGAPSVSIIKVSGRVDPVLADFVIRSLRDAASGGTVAVVLQVDSPGVVDNAGFDRMKLALRDLATQATPSVAVWIGTTGARAGGRAGELLAPELSDFRAMAPGSRADVDGRSVSPGEAATRGLVNITGNCDRNAGPIGSCPAIVRNVVGAVLPAELTTTGGDGSRQPVSTLTVRFLQVPLGDQFLHTVASPEVAYLLFVVGMALLLFELFTAGVGVAGVVGAGCFLLGCYGLTVLPARPVAVAVLVVSMFGFGVDVQTGVPRFWTAVGCITFVAGSLTLFHGVGISWVTLVAGIAGIFLAMLGGMPAMVRTRFSTPTIGREWMLGEEGTARTIVDPEGVVLVRGAPWRARTHRATPIPAGAGIRVRGIERLVLEVEPLTGAARDYRDRN
jgi:membrane-bound serine protease (ClpP class)